MVLSRIKDKIDNTLTPYLPLIQAKVHEVAAAMDSKTRELTGDDDKMRRIFRTVHARLPFAIRFAVKEQPFIEFCMRHKARFAGAADQQQGGSRDGPQQITPPDAPDRKR